MTHTVQEYKARFTIWSHSYIQTRQTSQDMESFIFAILLKQQQNALKTNQTRGIHIAEVMQRLDKMQRQVNPFAEIYKRMYRIK
jgi:hypothetical protein